MSSAFERLQKIAEEKRLKEKAEKPKLEVVPKVESIGFNDFQPIQSNPSNPTQSNVIQSKPTEAPIAPDKDYQKVPNSITRDAIPNRFFKGTSKNTYDALYLRTRGAVAPVRTIKATKRELMKWASVSDVTLFKHLKHLQSVGLLKIEFQMGAHDGSVYEVFIPEEIEQNQTDSDPPNPIQSNVIQSNLISSKKLGGDPSKKVGLDWMGNHVENKGTYEFPKTSLKTLKNDDDDTRAYEAFSVMTKRLDDAVKKITGKSTTKREAEKWGTLAELLILEFESAARQTDAISSAPAFLTEILRRKLLSGSSSVPKSQKAKVDTVGKPDEAGEYKIKPLDEKGREAALEYLAEFANDAFLDDFKKWYVEDDWNWLMKKLEKNNKAKR